MKKVFYPFFLSLTFLLLACGQKGPLYLADDGSDKPSKAILDVVTEQVDLAKPVLIQLNPLRIRGLKAQVTNPLAKDWDTVLASTKKETLRFVVFESDVLNDNTQKMVIGEVDQVNGQTLIPKGQYLRFREPEARYIEIPKILSAVKQYLKQNPNYQRADAPVDFIMDEQGFIDFYIQIKPKPRYRNKPTMIANKALLKEIANNYATPCYVYDAKQIKDNFRAYQAAFGNHAHEICYAVKANSNIHVLALLAELGAGFDVVSLGELLRVVKAGGDPKKVIFSGVGVVWCVFAWMFALCTQQTAAFLSSQL